MAWSSPWLLALLLLVPWWLGYRYRQLMKGAVQFPPLQLKRVAARSRSTGLGVLLALEGALLAACVAGLAGPVQVREVDSFREEGIDLALVLDISASMQAADFPPNRLEVLKQLASQLVRRRGGNRIAVYAYAGFVMTQAPFTHDIAAVLELIEGLSYRTLSHSSGTGGTATGDALLIALADLEGVRVEGRDQVVVLVTDGESNTGSDPMLAAELFRQQGQRLYVIGVGKDEVVPVFIDGQPFINLQDKQLTTRLDDRRLREMTEAAGGVYERADSAEALARIFERIDRLERKPFEVRNVRVESSRAPLPALLAFALLVAWLALDGLKLRRPLR